MRVFVALVEVRPLAGCALDPAEVGGAVVRSYVAAMNERAALARLEEALAQDRFAVVEVLWCVDDAATDWEDPSDPGGLRCVREAEESGEVVYGRFDSWPPGADA